MFGHGTRTESRAPPVGTQLVAVVVLTGPESDERITTGILGRHDRKPRRELLNQFNAGAALTLPGRVEHRLDLEFIENRPGGVGGQFGSVAVLAEVQLLHMPG